MTTSGGPAALRGYRLQTLYALYRLLGLTPGADTGVRLEGDEDLQLESVSGTVNEFAQVKAYAEPLTLSDLEPTGPQAPPRRPPYFRRVLDRLQTHPGSRQTLVSLGPLGPELKRAWQGDAVQRASVRRKLGARYREDEVQRLFEQLVLIEEDESHLRQAVLESIRRGMLGGDPDSALEILSYWLHVRSEARDRVDLPQLHEKVGAVGRYLAGRAAHHREWFTSILPVGPESPTASPSELAAEFYQGIGARYDHILAGVDVVRSEKLEAIAAGFQDARVVIVRGASGQGKSALAYRFLHDFVPRALRFEVRRIDDLRHAQSISTALLEHVTAAGALAFLYVDVQPRDRNWIEVVERIARHRDVRLLVTVREEDWTRAASLFVSVRFREVELAFDEDEARRIFEQLTEQKVPVQVLSFDDAWRRFRPAGPLLEFVYLVTQDRQLRARLQEQVRALQQELSSGELDFLRVVSVATAFGARLRIARLVAQLGLDKPQLTLARLEREYLLRSSPDGLLVDGLHPIRSAVLAELLIDPALAPWPEAACKALPSMAEPDLEVFLLYSLSRHQEATDAILEELRSLAVDSWMGVAGVLRALLWLGVREHVRANRAILDELRGRFGAGWSLVLYWDIVNLRATYPGFADVRMEEQEWVPPERRAEIAALRAGRTHEVADFVAARGWLAEHGRIQHPATAGDWAGVAETSFWCGYWNVEGGRCLGLPGLDLQSAIATLRLEEVADVLFGLSFVAGATLQESLAAARSAVLERFQAETSTVAVISDADAVVAHFIVDLEQDARDPLQGSAPQSRNADGAPSHDSDLHSETIRRLTLLRKILPEAGAFGCQGYGHRLRNLEMPHDPTTKRAIPQQHFPPFWALKLNVVFIELVDHDHRPATWQEHAQIVLDLRTANLERLAELRRAVALHFRRQRAVNLLGESIDVPGWDALQQSLNHPPALPRSAVDEWGYAGESRVGAASESHLGWLHETLALWKHRPYVSALRAFTTSLASFYLQSIHTLALAPRLGRVASQHEREVILERAAASGLRPNFAPLSTHNLASACKELPRFQREFRTRFAALLLHDDLRRLEERESRDSFTSWAMWHQLAMYPGRITAEAERDALERAQNVVHNLRRQLRRGLKTLSRDGLAATLVSDAVPWEEAGGIWVSFDIGEPRHLWESLARVLVTVVAAMPSGDSLLALQVLEMKLPHLLVIPLLKGRAIDPAVWSFSTWRMASERQGLSLQWWNLAQRQVPPGTWSRLRVPLWEPFPRLEQVKQVQADAGVLYRLIASSVDLQSLPQVDDGRRDLLANHLQVRARQVELLLARLQGAVAALVREAEEASLRPETPRPHLAAAARMAADAWESFRPPAPIATLLQGEQLQSWLERLEGATQTMETARLLWLTDVLERCP